MTFLSPEGEPLQNPYEVLGLNLGASDDEVNKSFKKLMLKLHPDKRQRGLSQEETTELDRVFQDVRNAKTFLLDTEYMAHKRAYDSKLAAIERRKDINPLPVLNRSSSHGFQNHEKQSRPNPCFYKSADPCFNKSAPDLRRHCDTEFPTNMKRASSNEHRPGGQDTKPTRRPEDNPRERRSKPFFSKSSGHRRARNDDCPPTDSSSEAEDPAQYNNKIPSSGRRERHDHNNSKQNGRRNAVNVRLFRRRRSGLKGVGKGVTKEEISSNRANKNSSSEQDKPEPKASKDPKRPPANPKSTMWRKSEKSGNK
jgi:hypothetical protein